MSARFYSKLCIGAFKAAFYAVYAYTEAFCDDLVGSALRRKFCYVISLSGKARLVKRAFCGGFVLSLYCGLAVVQVVFAKLLYADKLNAFSDRMCGVEYLAEKLIVFWA